MRTIRVFVSSPGDVQKERKLAEGLIRAIAAELGFVVSVTYSDLLRDLGIWVTSAAQKMTVPMRACPECKTFRNKVNYYY